MFDMAANSDLSLKQAASSSSGKLQLFVYSCIINNYRTITLEYYCETCDVSFLFKSKLQRHCLTQSHKQREKLLNCASDTSLPLLQVYSTMNNINV